MFAGIAGAVIFGESLLAESEHTLSGARMAFTLKEKKKKTSFSDNISVS